MLDKNLSARVLTVGCAYDPPKGGVAQVLYNYEQYVFPKFKCVVNSGDVNKIYKLYIAIVGLIKMAFKLIFDKKIKVVHVHTASYNSFRRSVWYIRLAKLFKRKVVLTMHGGGFKEYYATEPTRISAILNRCDAIAALSDSWVEFYRTITDKPNIVIIPNIVASPRLNENKSENGRLKLLMLGKVCNGKGVFDLLEVLADHLDEFCGKIELHIGGNGEIDRLKEFMSAKRLEDVVVYDGFVFGAKKIDLLNVADAYILPSYTEGLPVSILEAMSYGKAILSTPVGGIPEVVKSGENGVLFKPGDKDAIYDAIKMLIVDRSISVRMGEFSKKRASQYLPENVSKELERLYQSL